MNVDIINFNLCCHQLTATNVIRMPLLLIYGCHYFVAPFDDLWLPVASAGCKGTSWVGEELLWWLAVTFSLYLQLFRRWVSAEQS